MTGKLCMVKPTKPCARHPAKPYDLQRLLDGYKVLRDGSSLKVGRAVPISDGLRQAMLLTDRSAEHHSYSCGTEARTD